MVSDTTTPRIDSCASLCPVGRRGEELIGSQNPWASESTAGHTRIVDSTDDRNSLRVRVFDPRRVYQDRVASRALVYLDNNVWIELRDASSAAALDCVAACHDAVLNGRVLFPLAFPAISEALEIVDTGARLRHCELLDRLSHGVTFRASQCLFDLEADRACGWLFTGEHVPVTRAEVFTSVPDHLAASVLSIPSGSTREMMDDLIAHLNSDPKMRSVSVHAEDPNWRTRHERVVARYVLEMTELRADRRSLPRLAKRDARRRALSNERIALLQSHFGRAMREVQQARPSAMWDFIAENGEGGNERVEALFARMPMLDQFARLMARDAMEISRKPQAQDFYDMEHGTIPPIYSDAFVTSDNRLASMVRSSRRGTAEMIGNLAGLLAWLTRMRPPAAT